MGKKLKLGDVQVQSFFTALSDEEKSKVRGGKCTASGSTCYQQCSYGGATQCNGCCSDPSCGGGGSTIFCASCDEDIPHM